jgi:fatty-acyl-CoA synthase
MTTSPLLCRPRETSPAKHWLRALERTAAISRNPHRVLPLVIDELANQFPDTPALLSDHESLTFRQIAERSSQYARWCIKQGLQKGDVVGLLLPNSPEYFCAWLGICAAGVTVALLNTNLRSHSLWHCIQVVRPKHIIIAQKFADRVDDRLLGLLNEMQVWVHGAHHDSVPTIDKLLRSYSTESLQQTERPSLSIDDIALHIYTSGTTGMPKAANVSHRRILQWAYWFAGMIDISAEDRMYNCLPMYHSIGGVLVPSAMLVAGGSVVIREGFSTGQFWNDVRDWNCTMFQYIGEFGRYLLNTPPNSDDGNHSIRLACGNGMSSGVWTRFQDRFNIPRILEFYASTEGGLSLFNMEGEPGAIGRVPAYLAHRYCPVLVRIDHNTGEPLRNERGLCIRCEVNEAGEALSRADGDSTHSGSRFEGYTDRRASESRLLRGVLEDADLWVRSGDLMRQDERGFFYFVDRLGDTFRWKGENVATTEVTEAITSFPGIAHAVVYGVHVHSAEGRVGMAAIVPDSTLDMPALREYLADLLPSYARPAFFRLRDSCTVTGTFKYSKQELMREGFDPTLTADAIYFDNPKKKTMERVDHSLFQSIQSGKIQL